MCLMGFSTNLLFSSCPFYILTLYRSHWIDANIYATYHVTISSKPSYFFLEGEEKFVELKEMIKVTRLKKLRFTWLSKVLPKGIGSHWRGEASPMELPRVVTFAGVVLLVKWWDFFFYVTPITRFYKQLLNSKVFQTWVQFFVVVCPRCLWRAKMSVHVSPGSQVTWVCITLIYKNSCLGSRKMAQTEVKSSHCSCKGPQSVSSS